MANVDCTASDENKALCGLLGLTHYPSLYWHQRGVDAVEAYAGARTSKALKKYVLEKSGNAHLIEEEKPNELIYKDGVV